MRRWKRKNHKGVAPQKIYKWGGQYGMEKV